MRVGQGDYQYEPVRDWAKLPSGWTFGWIPAIAVDSRDRVYVYSRSEHPMVVFDRDGNFLTSWGEDLLHNAHGLRIDAEDNLYCTEWKGHCVHKLTSDGELQWTLGTPGVPRPPGLPFNLPTDLAIAPDGCLFVSDGYGNAKVHKFSPDGVLLKSWGEPGTGPGQFDLVHDVWVDSEYLVYVCDRSNNRIQIFDGEGIYLREGPIHMGPTSSGSIRTRPFSLPNSVSASASSTGTADCSPVGAKRGTVQGNSQALPTPFGGTAAATSTSARWASTAA